MKAGTPVADEATPSSPPGNAATALSPASSRLFAYPTTEIVGAILGALLSLPLLCMAFGFDQWVFSNIAEVLRQGGMLYKDAWEHKAPGIFITYWLGFSLFGAEPFAVRLLEILAVAATCAALVRLGRVRLGSPVAGLAASGVFPLLYLPFGPNGAQPETFQLPLVLWAYAIWPQAVDARFLKARCLGAGLLISGAFLFKTPIALLGIPLLADRLLMDRGHARWRNRLELSGLALGGMAAPPLAVLCYFWCRGAWAETWDALWQFPVQYAVLSSQMPLMGHVKHSYRWVFWMISIPAGAQLVLGVVRGVSLRPRDFLFWAGGFLAAWGTIILQARYHTYHHQILTPFLAWGMGMSLVAGIPDRGPTRWLAGRPSLLAASALLGLVSVSYALGTREYWAGMRGLARISTVRESLAVPPEAIEDAHVAKVVGSMTRPDDSLFIWGDSPGVYFMSRRKMAGPYCQLLQIVPPWAKGERLRPLLDILARQRPRLLIVTDGKFWWRGRSHVELLDDFPEMKDFIRNQYRGVRRLGRYQIHELRDSRS
jgi:hypothetical protein